MGPLGGTSSADLRRFYGYAVLPSSILSGCRLPRLLLLLLLLPLHVHAELHKCAPATTPWHPPREVLGPWRRGADPVRSSALEGCFPATCLNRAYPLISVI
mmetsp:Transcript_12177/g.32259  ORF Transcript_12177/g.32259 Transcript_12177/m.32259 type:complete len:101 (+) Transcript_12177:86-388(+)